VALEIVVLAEIGFVSANGLFFNGFDHRREQAVQAEGLALLMGEGSAFVQRWCFEERVSPQMRREPGRC